MFEFLSAIIILVIQITRVMLGKDIWTLALIKAYFNFITFQIYMIIVISEYQQIQQYIDIPVYYNKRQLYIELEQYLTLLSFSIYCGIVFLIILLKNVQSVQIRRLPILNVKIYFSIIQSILTTGLFQFLFIACSLYQYYYENTPFSQVLKLVYIRSLLLFSSLSSMKPIMQVLLEIPLQNFIDSFYSLSQPFIKEIKFKYVQLQYRRLTHTDEEQARISQDFDEEEDNKDIKFFIKLFDFIKFSMHYIKFFLRFLQLIYNTVQLCLALLLIFGFICIFIQVMDPNNDVLSKLNAVDYFSDNLSKPLETMTIAIFKFIFIIVMYLQSNNCIQYSQNNKLIDNVNNIVVIIRKNILNFSLIALLTTLYPNLTFTINNSDCFKDITYHNGQWLQNEQQYKWDDKCPVTLIYLITSKIFDSQITTMIGLAILLIYILLAIYSVLIKFYRHK
ncbi:hypothetical protein pb186bvf_016959 [Paramecium bursaria]